MQTLGLASEQKPTDGVLKRLFWPTIENSSDVDLVRKQGFWLCFALAVLSLMSGLAAGPVVWAMANCAFFLLGAAGLREGSRAAAVMVFAVFLLTRIVWMEVGAEASYGGNPLVGLVAVALLLSNVRATFLVQQWRKHASEGEMMDEARFVSTWKDRLVNAFPAGVWPKGQYVFFPLAGALILLLAIAAVRTHRA